MKKNILDHNPAFYFCTICKIADGGAKIGLMRREYSPEPLVHRV